MKFGTLSKQDLKDLGIEWDQANDRLLSPMRDKEQKADFDAMMSEVLENATDCGPEIR